MKILVISENGRFLGVAQRLQEEGNIVVFTTFTSSSIGNGIIKKPLPFYPVQKLDGSFHPFGLERIVDQCLPELVIVEGGKVAGQITNKLREMKVEVYGPPLISDLMENPSFHSLQWKTLGIKPCEVGGFWNGESFVYSFNLWKDDNLIGKQSGPLVNASTIGVSIASSSELEKLIPLLQKHYHRGFIGINKTQIHFTTPLSFFELFTGSLTSFFSRLTKMEKPLGQLLPMYFGENLLSYPPFPYLSSQNSHLSMLPIKLTPDIEKHFFLCDGEKKGGTFYCSTFSGEIGYVCARGQSIGELTRRVYRTHSHLWLPNCQYRTDFGQRVYSQIKPFSSVPQTPFASAKCPQPLTSS